MSELEEMMNKVLSSPEDMSRIMQLAQSLSGAAAGSDGTSAASDGAPPTEPEAAPALDPEMTAALGRIMRGLSAANAGSDKLSLITAIKPYLRTERQGKLERAMKIARIAKIAGSAFNEMGGGSIGL